MSVKLEYQPKTNNKNSPENVTENGTEIETRASGSVCASVSRLPRHGHDEHVGDFAHDFILLQKLGDEIRISGQAVRLARVRRIPVPRPAFGRSTRCRPESRTAWSDYRFREAGPQAPSRPSSTGRHKIAAPPESQHFPLAGGMQRRKVFGV